MILIALGANLSSRFGEPEETLNVAVSALEKAGIEVLEVSSVWLTAPVPASDQPWYRNAVARVDTQLGLPQLLGVLQSIEDDFGRVRSVRNAPRLLDLDIIACNDVVSDKGDCLVPHPRMHIRAFVLKPLQEVAPGWIHPVLGLSVEELIEMLPAGQEIQRFDVRAA